MATIIKKRPVQTAQLAPTEKCSISNPATTLAYSDRVEAEEGHWKVTLKSPDVSCPQMTGVVYLFGGHWTFTDK